MKYIKKIMWGNWSCNYYIDPETNQDILTYIDKDGFEYEIRFANISEEENQKIEKEMLRTLSF